MTIRELIAEEVLLGGEFRPAHLQVRDGVIHTVTPLEAGRVETRRPHPGGRPMDGTLRVPQGVQVLPGVVDTHVHINEPGRTSWEGFFTATAAAALGGVTSVVDMPLNSFPPTVSVEALRQKQRSAAEQLHVDTGFWGGIVPGNTAQLRPLWEAGVHGFKCFLLPSGVEEFPPVDLTQLHEAMAEVASFDGLVIVHAEDASTIEDASAAAGPGPEPDYGRWALSRPPEAEVRAIEGVVRLVRETGCRTHILHLASAGALEIIAAARQEGLPLTVETCPHYLCFEAERIPVGAAEFKCCPPIRDAGNREALWQGLQEGLIDCVVSDHSPATITEKYRGAPDLQQAWGGISGLQVGFAAVTHQARLRGIGLEQVVGWMAGRTAELVGRHDKGSLERGKDADIVLYDPQRTQVISAQGLAHRNPVSAYDGAEIRGAVVGTLLRGTPLFGDRLAAAPLPSVSEGSAELPLTGRFLQGPGAC